MVRVLVVEDDDDTREVLRTLLEEENYGVVETINGLEALEMMRTSAAPLVVVLDLDLPKLDGIGVLNAVAKDARLAARVACVLLTAVDHNRYKAAGEVCAALGVPLMLKPFDLDALLDAVAAAARRLPVAP